MRYYINLVLAVVRYFQHLLFLKIPVILFFPAQTVIIGAVLLGTVGILQGFFCGQASF